MKKNSMFTTVGMLIYVVVSIVDRFVVEIHDYIYISIMIIALVIIIAGIIKQRQSR